MNKKLDKADVLYMELVSWLLENYKHVHDDYQVAAFEAHVQQWRDYMEGEE